MKYKRKEKNKKCTGYGLSCKTENGFIALVSIVIVGAIALVISVGLSLRSIGEMKMSLNEQLSNTALSLADACVEYGIAQLKNDLNYAGDETIIIDGSDSCFIFAVEGSGNDNRIIKTQAIFSGFTKKVEVVIAQVNPATQVTLWEEVADF